MNVDGPTHIWLLIGTLFASLTRNKAGMYISSDEQLVPTYMQEHNPKNKYLLQGSGILNTIYLSYIDEYLYIFT